MAHVKSYNCLTCKAPLSFNPGTQSWKCDYCFNSFTLEDLEKAPATAQQSDDLDTEMSELDSYNCKNCGAELITDGTTSATFCLYCKSPSVIKARFTGKFKPKLVIPFKLTQNEAEELYKTWIKKRFFTPDLFKAKETIEEIKGIYAPFWMYDTLMKGYIEGEGTTISTWTTGDYNYTRTKYYRVVREGTVSYNKVPVDASIKLDDELMHKIEPFDYNDMVPFNMQFMSGFLAERYDVESTDAQKTMIERVIKYTKQKFNGSVTGYSSFSPSQQSFKPEKIESEYVLMPIYLLINKFNDNSHVFIVNGQTGKVVGDAPISRKKQAIFTAISFAVITVVSILGGALIV